MKSLGVLLTCSSDFLDLGSIDVLGMIILYCGRLTCMLWDANSIPSLYLVQVSSAQLWQPNVFRYCHMFRGSRIVPSWEPLLWLNSMTLRSRRQEADKFNMNSHRSWISKQKDFIWMRNSWGHFDWESQSLDLDAIPQPHPTPQPERLIILTWLWSWGWWVPPVEGVNDFLLGIFVQIYLDFFTN